MAIDPGDIRLEESDSKGRYVYRVGDDEAEMTFSKAGARLVIIDHTEVPDAFRGQGVGPGAGGARRRRRPRRRQEDPAALPVRGVAVPPPSGVGRPAAGRGGARHELEPDARPDLPDRRRASTRSRR